MSKLDDIIEIFRDADPEETMAMLLDYSDNLPDLPPVLKDLPTDETKRVRECETPVYLWVDVTDGVVELHAQVPRESPAVRGFVSLLVDAFGGSSPTDVLEAPETLLDELGLAQKLGTRRIYGLSAVYNRIKNEVSAHIS